MAKQRVNVKDVLRKKQQQQNTRRDGLAAILSDLTRVDTTALRAMVRGKAQRLGADNIRFSEEDTLRLRSVGMLDDALEFWRIGKHAADNRPTAGTHLDRDALAMAV